MQLRFGNLSLAFLLSIMILCAESVRGQDVVLSDFEQSNYEWLPGGVWTATGTCFGAGPAQGALSNQNSVSGYLGNGLVNTYFGGDNSIGTLTSPSFTITHKYIRFLIGGGNWRPETSINLLIDAQVVRTAVGMGEREQLDWLQWNVGEFVNKTAQIQIIDSAGPNPRGWQHINVDEISATDEPLPSIIVPNKRYLLLPVKNGVSSRMVELVQEGLVVREMNVELSATSDYWAFMDLAPFQNKELVVRLDSRLANAVELQKFFVQSDSITAATPIYSETLRPIYHYSAKRGYLSDPNDLVYLNGEYHMGYQHNQFGTAWDNMHHGHAISKDLIHWTELPETLYETYRGEAWNGSSVIDRNNAAGFGSGSILTFYTSAAGYDNNPRMSRPNYFTQSLAYSIDSGRTFTNYVNNPLLPNIDGSANHDPKVFWYSPGNVWVMLLFVDNGRYDIFNSTDLKNWVFTSTVDIAGTTEVPDLYPLALDGDTTNIKWVFSSGYREYIIGAFDGKKFTQQYGPFWFGRQKYDLSAALTFGNIPATDGRRIMMTNGRTDYPGMPFNRYMNLPSELTLKTGSAGVPNVYVNPVAEVSNLRINTQTWSSQILNTGINLMDGILGEGIEMEIVFKPQPGAIVTFNVGGYYVQFNSAQNKIGAGENGGVGQFRNLSPVDDQVHIRVFYDRGSWEVFGNWGEFYMPVVITPRAGTWPLSLTTSIASIEIVSLSLHHLGSIWGNNVSPVVSISSPEDGLSLASGSLVTVTANAADFDGTISQVEFFANGSSIGIDTTSAYSIEWTIPVGTYSLTAVATDNTGSTTTSLILSIKGTDGSATSSSVASIVTGTISSGNGTRGFATVSIIDNLGNPVPNATVTGNFSGSFSELANGMTNSNGSVKLTTLSQKEGTLTVNFCVTDVTNGVLAYDSSKNVITCTAEVTTGVSAQPLTTIFPEPSVHVFPNPFNDKLIVVVNLMKESVVNCSLLDSKGSLIAVLHTDTLPAGVHFIQCEKEISENGFYIIKTLVDNKQYMSKVIRRN